MLGSSFRQVRFEAMENNRKSASELTALRDARRRVRPAFMSTRYGQPTYARLQDTAPLEVRQGSGDEGEQGAFHDLYEPQRLAHLRQRLDEFTPASVDASVLFGDQETP